MTGLEGLLARYGLPLVFVGCFAEGDTAAVVSGGLAHRGTLPLLPTWALAFLGAYLADTVWFLIGRKLPDQPRFARHLEGRVARRARALVERRPILVILGFRFVWGTRTVVPLLLGMSSLPARLVLPLVALACLVWASALIGIGYGLGAAFVNILDLGFHAHFGLMIVAGIIVALVFGVIGRRLMHGARSDTA
ncbi:DedA family protein [Sulfitobacter sp. LCG007]